MGINLYKGVLIIRTPTLKKKQPTQYAQEIQTSNTLIIKSCPISWGKKHVQTAEIQLHPPHYGILGNIYRLLLLLVLTHIRSVEVHFVGELVADLVQSTIGPVSEPVQHTPGEAQEQWQCYGETRYSHTPSAEKAFRCSEERSRLL